jgi:hypothetical protein
VASQLFIEHSSGVNGLLALFAVAVCLKTGDKKRLLPAALWLAATAVGLAVMLAVPRIFHIEGNHTDTYRSVQVSSIVAIVVSCAKNLIQLSNHHFGACTLPMCLSAFGVLYITRNRRGDRETRLLWGINGISLIYLLLNLLLSQADYLGKGAIVQHVISTAFALLPYLVWVIACLRLEDLRERYTLLAILVIIVTHFIWGRGFVFCNDLRSRTLRLSCLLGKRNIYSRSLTLSNGNCRSIRLIV